MPLQLSKTPSRSYYRNTPHNDLLGPASLLLPPIPSLGQTYSSEKYEQSPHFETHGSRVIVLDKASTSPAMPYSTRAERCEHASWSARKLSNGSVCERVEERIGAALPMGRPEGTH